MRMKTLLLILSLSGFLAMPRELWASTEESLKIGDRTRTYVLHLPNPLPKGKLPVVLVFHGGTGSGKGTERLTKLSKTADREGFIAVYPDGIGHNWNDGREGDFSVAINEKIDDLGFVAKILDHLEKTHAADPKRIYATGISNGAIFSHYVAANMANRIAAIAPVVGNLADPFYKKFKPAEPVSVLILQGTADPMVPYNGGWITKKKRGKVISTDETVKLWVKADGCETTPKVEDLEDKDTSDGCTVTRSTYGKGKQGTEVVLYKIVGGGHTWPGGPQYLPKLLVGTVCRDIDANEVIWEFFKKHPKP